MLLLFASIVVLASAAKDASVCTTYSPGANEPKKPDLTGITKYKVRLEGNFVDQNLTAEYEEFFDHSKQKASLRAVLHHGQRLFLLYNFNTSELLFIDRDARNCTVSDLASSPYIMPFGTTVGHNTAKIFSTAGALRFAGNISEKYIGKTSIRGIPCYQWRSCLYMDSTDATFVMDWYFSAPGWGSTEMRHQVPIRARVVGVSNIPKPNYIFTHYYEFFDFKTDFKERKPFETPEGTFCPNRKAKRQLPNPAGAFHFTAEILDMNQHLIGSIKEWYDYNLKLVRFDITPMDDHTYGNNPQTQIHDFTTGLPLNKPVNEIMVPIAYGSSEGSDEPVHLRKIVSAFRLNCEHRRNVDEGVSYVIDQRLGNCTVTNISDIGFDVRHVDATHIRLRTSAEFFYFDKTAYSYEGRRRVRDILCDVWITRRTDYPPNAKSKYNSTWEWYFAAPRYTANLPDKLQFGMPMRLVIDLTLTVDVHQTFVYNIYDYDEQRPVVWDYDIGRCFNSTKRMDFTFMLPGNYRAQASSNIESFKYAVLRGITDAGNGTSPLRINNIQIDYVNNSDITVRFTLLERPPPIGDVVSPKLEPDLNTTAALIATAINNGTFQVKMPQPGQSTPIVMIARPLSLVPTEHIIHRTFVQHVTVTPKPINGYSSGVMAGMGVALLVVFFVLAVVGMYFYYRRQGGAFLPKKFDNTDITKDVS